MSSARANSSNPVDRFSPPRTHHARVILEDLGRALTKASAGMSGRAVLDFGSSASPYRSLFAGFDRYITADLPGESADLVIQDGRVAADDGTFDVVLSTQVLEHVPDPDAYLAEAHRLLEPTGRLVLSTHGIYWYHPSPKDLWRWTGPGLRQQVERCGFRVLGIRPVVSAPAAALTMIGQYAAVAVPRSLRPAWHFAMQSAVRLVNRFSGTLGSADDAAVFVVVAERA